MKTSLIEARYRYISRPAHQLFLRAIWKLPRKVAYWCAIRVGSNATVGEYRNQVVPDLLFTEALQRWEPTHEEE